MSVVRKCKFLLSLGVLFGALQVRAQTVAPIHPFTKLYGSAYNLENQLVYTEVSTFAWSGSKLESLKTEYSMDGKVFAHLEANFKDTALLPDTTFCDDRDGYSYQIQSLPKDEKIEVKKRAKSESEWETKRLDLHDDSATGVGVVAYFFLHATDLEELKEKRVHYVVPSRLDDYRVELNLQKNTPEDLTFSIRLANPFLRFAAPSMQVMVKKAGDVLAEFQGPTNISFEESKNKKLRVVFRRQDPGDLRQPAMSAEASHSVK